MRSMQHAVQDYLSCRLTAWQTRSPTQPRDRLSPKHVGHCPILETWPTSANRKPRDAEMEGYAKTANLMANFEELATFRQFKRLNYQNLLFQQAEIMYLEESLQRLAAHATDGARSEHATCQKNWWDLTHSSDPDDKARWKKFKRLRKKLTRYNEALVTQSFLAKLDEPNKQDLEFLRSWFERPRMGGFPIRGLDRRAWDPEHEKDLISFKPRLSPDLLSRLFNNLIFPLYHRLYGQRFKDPESSGLGQGIFLYRESRLAAIIETVVTVVASVLPLLSTIVLWLLKNETVKLGAIVALSAIFSFALATMTSARRVEIFAATAAFAAVNVVFLTGPPTATGETSCEALCQNAGIS